MFNKKGELLVTKRASTKKVWPGVWTNTACGHPMLNETDEAAIVRRLQFELGMKVSDVRCVAPTYRYKTPLFNGVIENELCPVYVAVAREEPRPNPDEVDEYRWMSWGRYSDDVLNDTEGVYSYWAKDQYKHIAPLVTKNIA